VLDALLSTALFIAAIPAGLAPRRYWQELDVYLPISRAAFASALATFVLSVVISVPAFFAYAEGHADTASEMMVQVLGIHRTAVAPSMPAAQVTWVSSLFVPFTFAFFTPVGLFSTYLTLTGVIRMISVFVDDARGDPILTIIDGVARRLWTRRRERDAQASREELEGPEVPDILVSGASAGCPDADLVVIASRRKPEWDAGAIVVTDEKWFKLGVPTERDMPGGLRTLYPLTELNHHEVLRRAVRYTLPALKGGRRSTLIP
jgi:hypothetical protein